MSTERVCCKAEGCQNTILPETAGRTGGYCMRCENKRLQQERAEYIRKNRREVDPYEGLTDLVDLISACHKPRKLDPLISYKAPSIRVQDMYAGLTAHQRDRMVGLAIEARRAGDKNFAHDVARSLATYTDHDLSALAMAWVEISDFWPSVLFRGANATVRDAVIRFLDSWRGEKHQSLPVNHALCALAWIGDEIVQRRFSAWQREPASWQRHLHVGPDKYAHTGGWELDGFGRRDLVHKNCFAVVAAAEQMATTSLVTAFDSNGQTCPWCGRILVSMLRINTVNDHLLFLGWAGEQLEVLTCDACTCFSEQIFAKIEADGSAQWHSANLKPNALPADGSTWGVSPWHGVSIELKPRSAIQAVEPFSGTSPSQIGGHPSWVQDSAYPSCPDCRRTMTFIAQLDNSDFPGHEGVYYAFLCAVCRVTATSYQQT